MRLGLHRMSNIADRRFTDYVERVRPPFVKFLDPGSGDEALAAWCVSRGVQVIGRVYMDDQALGAEGGRQIGRVLAASSAVPSIRWWELHNESWHIPGEMDRYAELSIEFMKALAARDRRGVIGCFAEGTPQADGSDNHEAWRQFSPAVAFAIQGGHALGLHEYSAPVVNFAVEADGRGWHTLRYRRALQILASFGLDISRLKILITEYGLDDIQDAKRPGPSGKGWRDYDGTEWSRAPLSPHGDFAGQTAWYCRELAKDPQVKGVVDFGFASIDKRSWESFDLNEAPAMLERMIAEMVRLPHGSEQEGGTTVDEQLATRIRAAGDAAQVLRLNRSAALQKAATAAGYLIVGNETTVDQGATRYVVQKAEHPTTGEPRWYYANALDWSRVYYLGKA